MGWSLPLHPAPRYPSVSVSVPKAPFGLLTTLATSDLLPTPQKSLVPEASSCQEKPLGSHRASSPFAFYCVGIKCHK